MASLQEALKKAGLVDPKKLAAAERRREADLKLKEDISRIGAEARGYDDHEKILAEERYHKKAAKEGRKPASNSTSKQYLNRFKK